MPGDDSTKYAEYAKICCLSKNWLNQQKYAVSAKKLDESAK